MPIAIKRAAASVPSRKLWQQRADSRSSADASSRDGGSAALLGPLAPAVERALGEQGGSAEYLAYKAALRARDQAAQGLELVATVLSG
jgi:hypothetical protein